MSNILGISDPRSFYIKLKERGTLLFQCNYDTKYLNLSANLPAFYKDVISHWQELNNVVPATKKDVGDQIVWNNRFIKKKVSPYFRSWHQAGIGRLSSLLDESNTRFLSLNEFLRKFKVKCNFLQYHALLSAMPSVGKNI